MKITLIPQVALPEQNTMQISINNDILTIDGVDYDFSVIPDNSVVKAEFPAIGEIKRVNGEIEISIIYQFKHIQDGYDLPTKEECTFNITSGQVPCPIKWKEEETQ